MTLEKAIEAMKFYKEKLYNGIFNQFIAAFDIAISALEKQIPKKTLWGGTNNASWRSCPECHSRENKTHKYCSQCGQKLSWESDTE